MTEDIRRNILDERERAFKPAPRKARPLPTDKLADYRDKWMNTAEDGPRSYEPELL